MKTGNKQKWLWLRLKIGVTASTCVFPILVSNVYVRDAYIQWGLRTFLSLLVRQLNLNLTESNWVPTVLWHLPRRLLSAVIGNQIVAFSSCAGNITSFMCGKYHLVYICTYESADRWWNKCGKFKWIFCLEDDLKELSMCGKLLENYSCTEKIWPNNFCAGNTFSVYSKLYSLVRNFISEGCVPFKMKLHLCIMI